jgi:hypothetical protein
MIRLVRLVFTGAARTPAAIEFGPRLTLVRGPSDTGKSFIVDAVDFMLGSRQLKDIPEREGYSRVMLVLALGDEYYTLTRSVTGGALELYTGSHEEMPSEPPIRTLADRHNSDNADNLSMWLLGELGVAGARLRKNAQNATVSLSFRDLAHLTIVDETQMQSEVPPALTGRYDTKTKEVAVLKLMLENDDDSGLTESPLGRDVRRLKGAKLEVVDQLIASTEGQLAGLPSREQVLDQVARLSGSINRITGSIREATKQRSNEAESLSRDETRARAARLRRGQIATLQARFGLLRQQYESDVLRLTLVAEGGRLLDLFESGPCPLCGASVEHQNHEQFLGDQSSLSAAAAAEIERTRYLVADLDETFDDLADSDRSLAQSESILESRISDRREKLQRLEASVKPGREELADLVSKKTELEASLAIFAQFAELQRIRAQIEQESTAETVAAATALGVRAVSGFSEAIQSRLRSWGYPDADRVEYDRTAHDIKAGDQFRAAHGKGVRSILHAAFTVGLADYCLERAHPHPGFVVIDSPLVTYRAPGIDEDAGPDRDFATRFYHDLATTFDAQIIVMENTDPLDSLEDTVVDVRFTKESETGRYGFFDVS